MKIYHFLRADRAELCRPIAPGQFTDLVDRVNGTPQVGDWAPVDVEIVHRDEGKPLSFSDAPWFEFNALVLRQSAVDCVGALLLPHGELLKLSCAEADLWLFNATTFVDVIDEERSKIFRHQSGAIMHIQEYVFNRELGELPPIFRVPNIRISRVYMTETFRSKWEACNLTGVTFKFLGCAGAEPPARARD